MAAQLSAGVGGLLVKLELHAKERQMYHNDWYIVHVLKACVSNGSFDLVRPATSIACLVVRPQML